MLSKVVDSSPMQNIRFIGDDSMRFGFRTEDYLTITSPGSTVSPGCVGIGTSSPEAKLHVEGDVKVADTLFVGTSLQLRSGTLSKDVNFTDDGVAVTILSADELPADGTYTFDIYLHNGQASGFWMVHSVFTLHMASNTNCNWPCSDWNADTPIFDNKSFHALHANVTFYSHFGIGYGPQQITMAVHGPSGGQSSICPITIQYVRLF
mmetsp:Transcript_10039/g.32930  ORF Transcript_10039/g.32930 Transcript_10039/m.32930 type:complete len:207 (+) Transcript_10039:829-1449(+)